MKLRASIAEKELDVEVRRQGSRVFARVDERSHELEARDLGNGSYLLISAARVFEARVEGNPNGPVDVVVGTDRYSVAICDPKRMRIANSAAAHVGEAARVIAPMPGKVVRVLVEAGAEIKAGAGLVVVEAMKMQNEMKSPKAGVVAALNVEVGATVNAGDVLVIIE